MSLGAALLLVAGGWCFVGVAFWAALVRRGYHFELRGMALPRIRHDSVTLAHRDELLAAVREQQASKAALLN